MARSLRSRIPKEAKILIVIIVLIAAPSIVLTSMAVFVVGREARILKRQTEEIYQKDVNIVAERARRILADVRSSVEKLCNVEDPSSYLIALDKKLEEMQEQDPILKHYFVFDTLGRPRTYVSSRSPWRQDFFVPLSQKKALRLAMKSEHQDKDYRKAAGAYRQALLSAGEDITVIAAALNGEARCYFSLGEHDTAIKLYDDIQNEGGLIHDSSGLWLQLVARYQIGRILRLQGKDTEYVRCRLSFLSWLIEREALLIADPSQREYYEQRVRMELRDFLNDRPDDFEEARKRFEKVERQIEEHVIANQQISMLVNQASEYVRRDMALGRFGSTEPLFIPGTLGPGEPAVICYGLCRRKEDGAVIAAVGYVLDSAVLRGALDPANEPALRYLKQPNLRIQILDEANDYLVGEQDVPVDSKGIETVLPHPYPNWRIRMVAVGPELATSTLQTRGALLIGLVCLSTLVLGLGIFVIIWTSSRELRTARMRSDFVSAVTHELKTPLTSIRMFSEMLLMRRYRDEDEMASYLTTISEESERLTRLIERVLNFARIERGRRTYSFEEVDVGELTRQVMNSMQGRLEQEGFRTTIDIESDLPHVKADPDAISDIFVNLIGNAIKYSTVERLIEVRVWHQGNNVRVSIRDHGIGISHKEQKRVFEEFYRSDDRRVQELDGTGLGLTMSRAIALAHGGDIELQSRTGKGSTFTLVLPTEDETISSTST